MNYADSAVALKRLIAYLYSGVDPNDATRALSLDETRRSLGMSSNLEVDEAIRRHALAGRRSATRELNAQQAAQEEQS